MPTEMSLEWDLVLATMSPNSILERISGEKGPRMLVVSLKGHFVELFSLLSLQFRYQISCNSSLQRQQLSHLVTGPRYELAAHILTGEYFSAICCFKNLKGDAQGPNVEASSLERWQATAQEYSDHGHEVNIEHYMVYPASPFLQPCNIL